uniref:hypothetical protein n=1 Tax=Streptomyces albidus (ex Kaewkla and Franco 2022) TaxID=722709 RepID=UPI001B354489
CDEGRPQVCTVPSRAPSADASDSLAGVRAELRRVPGAPSRLIEVPFPLTGHPVEKARGRGDALVPPPLADFNVRPEHYAEAAAHEIAVFGCRKTVDGTTPVPEKYSAAVAAWLAPSAGDAAHGSGRRVLERVKTMPEHARTAWLGDYFTAVRDCRPGRIEAP